MRLAPIALFVYNRKETTLNTIEALKNNYLSKESDLIIFSDGPKNEEDKRIITELRSIISKTTGFKSLKIYNSNLNKGLANSIINGVTLILKEYNSVIVMEDDLVSTPNFLDFMNANLDKYYNKKNIISINGYSLKVKRGKENLSYDNYFVNRPYSWGWGTWKHDWEDFLSIYDNIIYEEIFNPKLNTLMGKDVSRMLERTLNGKVNSWYSKWIYYHFIIKGVSVYPYESKIVNIGFDDKGTHCKNINSNISLVDNSNSRKFNLKEAISVDPKTNSRFLKYFSFQHKLFFRLSLLFKNGGLKALVKELKSRI